MIKTELDNVSNAAFGKDVLIIHGTDDRIVPLQRGQTLFQQLPQKHKTFITINGRAHNDVLSTDQSWAEMESFVR